MVSRSDRGPRKSANKGGFQYKPRDPAKLKERSERKGGNFDSIFKSGFDTWRPKEGDNLIRILPPTWDDFDHYGYEIWIHRRIGADDSMYLCLSKMKNKPCPICDAAKAAKDGNEDDEFKSLRTTNAFVVWMLNRDEKDELPMLWQMSWTQDRDVAALGFNKRSGNILAIDHPDEGYDLTIKRTGSGLRTKYFGLAFDRDPSPISAKDKKQDEILEYITENPIPSVLNFYDAEYLDKVLNGVQDTRDEDLDDEKPRRGKRGGEEAEGEDEEIESDRRGRGKDRDDDEDEKPSSRRARDGDDTLPDDDDEKPARGARRNARDADSDDDGDDDAPAKKSRRGASHDDDDDTEPEEENEKPRGRRAREEEEEENPKSRRERGDDDEKPRGKRRGGDDDGDDDEPRSRRGASRDDDDDSEKEKPRGRRGGRKDNEDEEEEKPARRGRR